MKLFTSEQICEWDAYTVKQHYTSSIELMEVAANAVVFELQNSIYSNHYTIFCGTGNNGGDGLCIARLLADEEVKVQVFIVGNADKGTDDFRANLKLLIETDIPVSFLSDVSSDFLVSPNSVVLDCILGIGINRPVDGWLAQLIDKINELPHQRIAIDVPSLQV